MNVLGLRDTVLATLPHPDVVVRKQLSTTGQLLSGLCSISFIHKNPWQADCWIFFVSFISQHQGCGHSGTNRRRTGESCIHNQGGGPGRPAIVYLSAWWLPCRTTCRQASALLGMSKRLTTLLPDAVFVDSVCDLEKDAGYFYKEHI